MSRRAYVTADRLSVVRGSLDAEDRQLLAIVATVRLASAGQLEAIVGAVELGSVRRLRRRLRRLADLDVLARLERQVGGRSSGSAGFVYALGLVGQRLVSADTSGRVRAPWTPRPSWLQHALLGTEVFVGLTEAQRAGRLHLLGFEAEPTCWRPYANNYGQLILKPDAFVHTATVAYEQFHFIEVDRATESPATLARKFDQYRSYWQTGVEQSQRGLFPSVLWIVPDDRRRAVLLEVAGRQPAESWQLHQVRRFDDLLGAFVEEPP